MKIKFCPIQLISIVVLITNFNSCKKDDFSFPNIAKIVWANPADIIAGTVLSANQLNATANFPGTFVYTPPIGTYLSFGYNQRLRTEFKPTDTTYLGGILEVRINVLLPENGGVIFDSTKIYGTMTDQDGNIYKTITIGNQTWMAENLRVITYRNGDSIQNVTDGHQWGFHGIQSYCNYENRSDKNIIATYGRLYNWLAVDDKRNIAPIGWHVPTDDEWTTLVNYLGGKSVAGGKMKETGIIHWQSPNAGATNESGFTALPSGERTNDGPGTFRGLGQFSNYWSSSKSSDKSAWYRGLEGSNCSPYHTWSTNGLAVRCVKD